MQCCPKNCLRINAITVRKTSIGTGREPLVCTGSPPGTGRSVLNAPAFSTSRTDRY